MEKVYVIGHLNPDTDTVVSAISMAAFLNSITKSDTWIPFMTGKANSETEFVFKNFNLKLPKILEDATGKKLFLVDHNESTQRVKGSDKDNIQGFVDHHKINFENSVPIEIVTKPWGSTSTIIYYLFKMQNIPVPKELRPAMLCAILSDTVILKSPTATTVDKMYVEELSKELGINYSSLGMELFKAKGNVAKKSAKEIIKNDFKDFDFSGKKIGIGQIETPDLKEIEPKIREILKQMETMKSQGNYHSILLMLTDIIQEGSKLLCVSEDTGKFSAIFKTKFHNNVSEFIPGMMSRKKQVASRLSENF